MKSKNISILIIILLVFIILCLSGILVYRLNEQRKNEFRCFVNNELLQTGMTRAEVEQILSRFGEYQSAESHFPGGYFRLRIVYQNRATYDRFGGDFIIEFANDNYLGIWLPYGVGESKAFCK